MFGKANKPSPIDSLIGAGSAIEGNITFTGGLRIDGQVKGNVKATGSKPGTLVISAYVTCPDITKTVTPDLKAPGKSKLLYIDLAGGRNRLGGSALAQVFGQVGDRSPDLDDPELLTRTFNAVQDLVSDELLLAGHDRSDGGLVTTLLEMAFAGNCGIDIDLGKQSDTIASLFSEELGLVIEYLPTEESKIFSMLDKAAVPYQVIGTTAVEKRIVISLRTPNSELRTVLDSDMRVLRDIWEETSHQLDLMQRNPENIREERKNIYDRTGPSFVIPFRPKQTADELFCSTAKPKVAIIREEGSNGDREMVSAFFLAGFEPWDVTVTDLLEGRITLDQFRGTAFVGGFSYADVPASAQGAAASLRFH